MGILAGACGISRALGNADFAALRLSRSERIVFEKDCAHFANRA
jgi:hypothetical protein